MANPSTTVMHAVCGLAFDNVQGTTTTVVSRLITQAQNDIKSITGTTTGAVEDRAIRNLAGEYIVQAAMSKTDPNLGNAALYMEMRDRFNKDVSNALRLKGKTLDGIKVQFTEVNS